MGKVVGATAGSPVREVAIPEVHRPSTPLDAGIERAVHVLQAAGVHTYESCEGGDGHSYRDPTVRFYGSIGEGWRALSVCKFAGLPVRHLSRCWDMDDGEPSGPYWQIEFRRQG